MSLNLSKGQQSSPLNLSKSGGTDKYYVGLGWPDKGIDLDVTALVLGADGNVLSNAHVLFYNQKNKAEGFADESLIHGGDNRTGAGPGDDEFIMVDLAAVDPRATEIAFVVTMHEVPSSVSFKDLGTAEPTFIHILENDKNGKEVLKYTLTDVAPEATCLQFGSLIKSDTGAWTFQAVGAGGVADLGGVLAQYGVK